MEIILNIKNDPTIRNCKDIELSISDDEERRTLCEVVSKDYFYDDRSLEVIISRLTQLVSIEIKNYVIRKI